MGLTGGARAEGSPGSATLETRGEEAGRPRTLLQVRFPPESQRGSPREEAEVLSVSLAIRVSAGGEAL